jgi:autotransporter-associated beta strand protein
VTINNQNHLGNTVINGGTLTVGSFANAIGTDCGSLGDINKSITICNGATLSTNVSAVTCGQSVYIGASDGQISVPTNATLTMAKAILANGGTTLTKTGNGTLTLGSGNTISKLIVASGIVNSVEANNLVQLPSTVELQNATLWDPGSEGSYTTNASNFVIADGKTAYIYAKPRCEYTGSVSGAGKLYLYATGARGYYKGDWTHFTGTLVPGYKKRGTYDPSFDFTSSNGLPNATLLLNSGITFNATNTIEIGTVSGSGILAGSGKYILGNNGKDVFLTASATAPIIKRGTGTMRLTTAGNITGGVTVEEGSLFFNDTQLSTAFFGTNTVQATGTSKIVGRGLITTMIMNDGTTLEVRSMYSESTPGTLKTNASLSMLKGSTLVMVVKSNTSYSQLQPTFFTMNGTLKINLASDYQPAVGDSFNLWTVTRSFSGTPIYDLPTLPDGMYWDVSGLAAASGVLKITNDPAAGIGNLSADTEVDCEVFTLGGSKVATLNTEKGKVAQAVRNQGLNAGTYLVKMRGSNHVEMQKVLVR